MPQSETLLLRWAEVAMKPGGTVPSGARVSSGAPGIDEVLGGGLPARRMYLLQGDPGVGKTTLAIQFLLAGAKNGERGLYVTLSETREELEAVAHSHGWSLNGMAVFEMSAAEEIVTEQEENTLYVPSEVELGERIHGLLEEVERVKPTRVVIDSCSELRLLAQNQLRFRRQLLTLKQHLVRRNCTVILIENPVSVGGDPLLQSLVHGVIAMEQLTPLYGTERRRLRVVKMRELSFRGGYHELVIRRGGVEVFPRLVAAEHHAEFAPGHVSSGVPALDALLGGGLGRGTSALFMGPAGSGKSTMATQYALAAAERGENVAMFTFDEGLDVLLRRAASTGMELREHLAAGRVSLKQIDPAELSPGEFAQVVRATVEQRDAKLVIIDSLNGYLQSMPQEHFLTLQLHELLSYLRQRGVLTIMTMAQHGFLGHMENPVDVSYLADAVILTRYFEAQGRVRKAVSALKQRSSAHEDTIREFTLSDTGLRVGPPLADFHGILTGVPELRTNARGSAQAGG